MTTYTYGKRPYLEKFGYFIKNLSVMFKFIFKKTWLLSKKLDLISKKIVTNSQGKTFTILKIEIVKPWILDIKFKYIDSAQIYHIVLTADGSPYVEFMKNVDRKIEIEEKHYHIVRSLEHTKIKQ